MSDLKPCPFCGSAAHVWEDQRLAVKTYIFPKWYISCNGCGVKTVTDTMENVVRRWNRRVGEKE